MDKSLLKILILTWILMGIIPSAHSQKVINKTVEEEVNSEKSTFKVIQLVEGLEHPWAMTWLDDGSMLITERPGRLLHIDGDQITSVNNLPKIDTDEDQKTAPDGGNQGGLLDVVVHPQFKSNGWIYFTFSSPGDDDSNFSDHDYATGTALARAKISSDKSELTDMEVLYTQIPRTEPGRHYGSRIVFPGDGTVIFSIGDRGIRYPSQDLTDPAGSMIRIKEDGGVPEDNPFVNTEPGNLRPEIFSFGHRNNQGLAIDSSTGLIWTSEHGPFGGDLIHLVKMGKNYGWPQVSQGVEYSSKAKVGLGNEAPGVEKPKHIWEESMAPSGLAFHQQGKIAAWEGNLFAGSLYKEQLHRLEIEGEEVVHDEVLLTKKLGRIRDVRLGPDGFIYLLTDHSDGGLYRIEPK
ncbi:PQQ-dependent sugar dehydrogenase [Mongoliibacter ruber]|uniref:Glucose/arabinose dehydrogenase n=1 Tax=Mongoliibacter ruber TaxID=1750599 RepID=A0A2T0WVR9_9BACT|nr:PQQ-dependent sugar dehydrogenase [Mongoliibacter ruber]PRY90788.1 glucose/arabinose dehydrogenase [Mongoliibacter ruber]